MRIRIIALSMALLLAGCSSPAEPLTSSAADANPTTDSLSGASVTVWIDAELEPAFATISSQFSEQTGAVIKTEVKDFFSIENELPAAPGGSVDVFVGSSDWTDSLAQAGLIAKLASVGEPRDAVQVGFQYQGSDFGVAYSTENLALICNSKLVPKLPTTWQDLEAAGISISLNPGGDPYTMFYVESSFGDSVFTLDESGDYSRNLALGQDSGSAFASWLANNQKSFVSASSDQTIAAFSSGDLACWVSGNWALPILRESVDFELLAGKLPSAGGQPAKTFSSSRGFFQSAASKNSSAAAALMELLAASPVQQLIYESTGRTPATDVFLENVKDPVTRGFMEASADGVPIPPADQMQYVWSAWGLAQSAILEGQEPIEVWSAMARQITELVGVEN